MFAEQSSRWGTVLRFVLVLVTAAALLLVGRLTAPHDRPTRQVAGVPVGFPRTQDGARAAGMTYAAARARATLLAPDRRRALLRAIATGRFAQAADRQDGARDLAPLSDQQQARFLVTALGSRVDGFSSERVRLTVWLCQVFAADTAVGSFSTQAVALSWVDGDWRLEDQRDATVQAVPEVTQAARYRDTRTLLRGLSAPTLGRP